jgi:hypothetical protein
MQPANTGLAVHIPFPTHGERPYEHALPRGIGLVVDETSGALKFLGDPWEVEDFYESVQKLIVQKYTALSHAAALRQLGYQVALQQEEAGQIQVTAMR